MIQIDDHTTLTTYSSSRDDEAPFVAFKLESTGVIPFSVSVPLRLEDLESFIAQLQQQRDYVVEFEAQRGEPRAMVAGG